ncbi:MAG: phosphoribosylanthranilate isomerase [Beijerinckiaceae bacterium]
MQAPPIVKICGLSTAPTLDAALAAGADMVGFVFFGPSPRNVTPALASQLARRVNGRAKKVALTVDADDATLDAILAALEPDILQLHGRETPARTAEIRARASLPIMKALGVSTADDLAAVAVYEPIADWLLFDAKPPKEATRPGGNAFSFDWAILDAFRTRKPWLLSGGLDPANVAEALARTGAPGVDVSSGVESAPGVKDEAKIRAFVAAARGLS